MAVNSNAKGGISRPFYTVIVKLVQKLDHSVKTDQSNGEEREIDITHFINKLEIVKSMTVLTPVVVMDMAPAILTVLGANIIDEDYFKIEIYRSTQLNDKGGLVFKGEVFADDFEMTYSLAQQHENKKDVDPMQERSILSFFCKPLYFNKLLVHPENKVHNIKDKSVFEFAEKLIVDTWRDDFNITIKPSSSDGSGDYNKSSFDEDRMLVHKTTLIDYLRYLNQRWGFYLQAALFFTDFPALPSKREYNESDDPYSEPFNSYTIKEMTKPHIGRINLFSYKYLLEKSKNTLTVVLANDEIKYDTAEAEDGTPIIYITSSFREVRETPSRIMKSKTTVNFLGITRDILYDVDKRPFEGELEKLVKTKREDIVIRDFWKLEKSFMTNSVRNNNYVRKSDGTIKRVPTMAQASYFGDEFTTFRFFTFTPSFWTPWGEIGEIGKRVHVRSDIAEYTQRFDGDYIIYKVDLVLSRVSGGEEIWKFKPEVTLARQ